MKKIIEKLHTVLFTFKNIKISFLGLLYISLALYTAFMLVFSMFYYKTYMNSEKILRTFYDFCFLFASISCAFFYKTNQILDFSCKSKNHFIWLQSILKYTSNILLLSSMAYSVQIYSHISSFLLKLNLALEGILALILIHLFITVLTYLYKTSK